MLRRRKPDTPRPVRVFGYPLPPLLFVGAAIAILGNSFTDPRNPLIAFGVIVSGIPVYWLWNRLTGPPRQA